MLLVTAATGGLLITFMGWRSVFYLAMGPVTLIWLLSFCILPPDGEMSRAELRRRLRTFDTMGTILFVIFSGSALLVLNRGNDMGWDSTLVLASGAIAVVTLPLLIITERRATGALYRHTLLLFQSRSGFIEQVDKLSFLTFWGNI